MKLSSVQQPMLRSVAKVALLLFVVAICVSPAAFAQNNLLFINSNISTNGQNSIIVLQNDGAGNLSPVAGSPFPTLGTGVGGSLANGDAQYDSDGETAVVNSGTVLLAVNGHSNDLSAFKINSDGSLTLIAGSPFASGGIQPASIGFIPNALGNNVSLAVVANKNADPAQVNSNPPNYTTFQVGPRGVLKMNAGSTYALPLGTAPAMAVVPSNGRAAFFGIEFLNGTISSYTLDRQGAITLVNSLTPPGSTPFGVGAVAAPKVRGLYVTLPPQHQIGVFSYDGTSQMSYIREASNSGQAPCWVAINQAGTRLYVSETISGTMTVYDLTNSKSPVQLQHIPVLGTGPLPAHLKLDPTEKFLYILDRNGLVHVFDVASDGTVAENHTPYSLGLPSGTIPLGLSVLQK